MKKVANLFIVGFLLFCICAVLQDIYKVSNNIIMPIALVGASCILLGMFKSVSL